jgi:hypothetical protein
MAREHAAVGIVAAARAVADRQRDAAAAVEVGNRIGARVCCKRENKGDEARGETGAHDPSHGETKD